MPHESVRVLLSSCILSLSTFESVLARSESSGSTPGQ